MDLYVITGTRRGLGRALADHLLQSSQNVVVEVGRGVSGKNARNTALEADFSDVAQIAAASRSLEASVAAVLSSAAGTAPAFDRAVLFNNAGVVHPVARFDALDTTALGANLNVNLLAPLALAGAFTRATRGRANARAIVHISSGAARRAVRGWSAYCAAKAGLEMATRVAAEEARHTDPNLVICSLAPGVIDTDMQQAVRDSDADAFPERARFVAMKADGTLRRADAVAGDIIQLLHAGRFDHHLAHGANLDIRELLNA
jgi:benzil reductase ((S)-benzoin forming)